MKIFTFRTLSVVSLLCTVAAIVLCGCSRSELPVPNLPSGEQPSTGPFITDVKPRVLIPNYGFVVTGGNFDPTPGKTTLTIGNTNVPVTLATNISLTATLPTDFPSDEYPVSVTVNGQTGKFNGTVKVVSVYAVGWESGGLDNNGQYISITAKYWKNGVATDLTDGKDYGEADAIFVTDKDVHIVGSDHRSTFYWKSGVKTTLMGDDFYSKVNSVVVTPAGDVYVGGIYGMLNKDGIVLNHIITHWINGLKQTDITDGSAYASCSSLCVSGGDVYIAGMEDYYDTSQPYKYWKNGTPTVLNPSTIISTFPDGPGQIAVVGNDVYVVGAIYADPSVQYDFYPEYWVNGTGTTITNNVPMNTFAWATSIASSGNDIYIAGNIRSTGIDGPNIAGYWQLGNSSFVGLTDPSSPWARANSIAVSGHDVFVAGYEQPASSKDVAKFWVNGLEYKLTDGTNDAQALAIFIK